MQVDEGQLSSFLVESGILSRRDLTAIVEHQRTMGVSLQKATIHTGVLSADEFRRALAAFLGMSFVKLDPHAITADIFTLIPEPVARAHHIIAFARSGHTIEIASLEPTIPPLSFLPAQARVLIRLTDIESMKRALLRYQQLMKQTTGERIAQRVPVIPPGPIADIAQAADRIAVAELVDLLLHHAVLSHASDIHLSISSQHCTVRYRIEGSMYDVFHLPAHVGTHIGARFKQLAHLSLTSILPQHGQCRVEGEVRARLRIAATSTAMGEHIVVHLVSHKEKEGFTLEALGFHGSALERVHHILQDKAGILLVCGPAGAGKTTTLYTLLDTVAAPEKNCIAVERDHLLTLPGVVHVSSVPDVSFANQLRAALRQDPDILMIDSIADEESALVACTAANRGILVIAGIESYSAGEGVVSLQSVIPTFPLASVLLGSIGVSQVRKLCEQRETYRSSRSEMQRIESMADPVRVLQALKKEGIVEKNMSWKDLSLPRGVVCARCDGGYKGRIGMQEVLLNSKTLSAALEQGADAETLERIAQDEGMLTIPEDGIYKTIAGLTTLEEIVRVTQGE